MKKRFFQIVSICLILAIVIVVITNKKQKDEDQNSPWDDNIELPNSDTIVLDDSGAEVTFYDVILSDQEQTRKLVFATQEATVDSEINAYTLLKSEYTKKKQKVTYKAKGSFVVDLEKLDKDSIVVDKDNKKVIIKIPHAELDTIEIDPNKINVEDQSNAVLAFGDLTLTVKDYVELEKKLQDKLKDAFNKKENWNMADDKAIEAVKKVYEPAIKAVNRSYDVEVVFE